MIGFFRRKKPQDGVGTAQTRPSIEELAAAFPRAPGEALPVDDAPSSPPPTEETLSKADELGLGIDNPDLQKFMTDYIDSRNK